MDYDEVLDRASGLLNDAEALARELVQPKAPLEGSSLRMLSQLRSRIGTGTWSDADVKFPTEAARGLLAIQSAQLHGLREFLTGGSPLLLHPTVTLIRGAAEAGGLLLWLVEPWVNYSDSQDETNVLEWCAISQTVLTRSQVLWLDELANRRRRHEAQHGEVQTADQEAVDQFKQRLTDQHGPENVALVGGRKKWMIGGEKLPDISDRVAAITELSYGATFRGAGMNPYPMYAGYAHSSLEALFSNAGASSVPAMSSLLAASTHEAFMLTSLAQRLFAVMYELAAHALGAPMATFLAWEERSEAFVQEAFSE